MGRAPCCDKARVKRGPWSPEEDETLKAYLQTHGTSGNWIALPSKAGLKRCGKSCRLRWLNYLRPDIKHGGFTDDEDRKICNLYNQMGSRWSVIASHLPGRTDNDVKNYWNTKLKKKLLAGKISLNTNTNITSIDYSSTQIPKITTITTTNNNNTNYPPIINNSSDYNSFPNNPIAQSPSSSLSLQYSPRAFMELLDDQHFDTLLAPKGSSSSNSHIDHMSLLSQFQAGSGNSSSIDFKLGNGCEEFGDFGFGLPYSNNGIISTNSDAPSYCISSTNYFS